MQGPPPFPDSEAGIFFPLQCGGAAAEGDYESRMNGYAMARQNGWMSANDIRELENLDRIPPRKAATCIW